MDKSQVLRTGRHCVFAMHAHLVFVTKYRRNVFDAEAIDILRGHFTRVCEKADVRLIEMNGEDDHVHLLIEYAPNLQLSTLVNSLKGVSSRLLRKDRPDIAKRYWQGVLWSPSYFAASCGGAPLSVIRQYVEQQRTPTTWVPTVRALSISGLNPEAFRAKLVNLTMLLSDVYPKYLLIEIWWGYRSVFVADLTNYLLL